MPLIRRAGRRGRRERDVDRRERDVDRLERGVVLVVVVFFALLLASSIATFLNRALIDHMIVRNRDARAEALAIARGGVRLATALLLEDKLAEAQAGLAFDDAGELWSLVGGQPLEVGGGTLRLEIADTGSRLNLNSVIAFDENGSPAPNTEPLLVRLLEKAIEEIPAPPEQKRYDPAELAANLIDYVDADEVRSRGGLEDDAYQQRVPPARAANRPLLWVEELREVEGFDGPLVDALEPYVTVYPYVGGGGINPNTAPPHVLALLFFDDGVELTMAPEDTVREILRVRQEGGYLCGEEAGGEGCTPMRELVTNAIYPEPSYSSDVFVITARARVGDVETRVEAVIDRSEATEPLLLSWRVL